MQEPPFAVQIELAEGCNLYCGFCGLRGIREKKSKNFKFMTEATLERLMSEMVRLEWNPRVEFAMHGEPTMHPNYVGMTQIARRVAPRFQLMMTSNGGGIVREPGAVLNVTGLMSAGLNVLALDDYDGVKIVPKIRAALEGACELAPEVFEGFKFYDYPRQKAGSPHGRHGHSAKVVTYIESIDLAKDGNHSHLNNHCGAAAPPNEKMAGKRCAKPFRELSVRWDGGVAVCCNDWRGTYKCGNVNSASLDEIWLGPAMDAARRRLYLGKRDFGPCRGCDAVSHRVGLLPDKFGRVKMPQPDKSTETEIAAALAGPPMTQPVLRPWEKPAIPPEYVSENGS